MSAHTPGPWVAEIFASLDQAILAGHFEWCTPTIGSSTFAGPVGCVWKQFSDGAVSGLPACIEASAADARLIAAAPDMYDALKSLDARLRKCAGEPITANEAYDSFYQDVVLAAIAKAEGT